jgi:hypothetical protein
VSGWVNRDYDRADVYKIKAASGQRLTISMSGSGGDADLYLFRPGISDIYSSSASAGSAGGTNSESIDEIIFSGGDWYIVAYSFSGTTSYNITVNVLSS